MFVAVARALGARVRRNRRAEPDGAAGARPRQQCAPSQASAARPDLEEPVQGHRHDRHPRLQRRDGRALLEPPGCAVRRPLALGEQREEQVAPEPEGPGLHRAEQVRVGIDRHHVHQLGEPAHERRLEVLARADEEQAAERPVGERPYQEKRVEVALVVRAEEVRALRRQVLAPLHAKPEEQSRQQVQRPDHHVRQRAKQRFGPQDPGQHGVRLVGGQHPRPRVGRGQRGRA